MGRDYNNGGAGCGGTLLRPACEKQLVFEAFSARWRHDAGGGFPIAHLATAWPGPSRLPARSSQPPAITASV